MGSLLLLISLQIVCRNFPVERTVDFMMAIKETIRTAKGVRVRAAGKWMTTFLQMIRKDICWNVRDFLPPVLFFFLAVALCLVPFASCAKEAQPEHRVRAWQHVKGAGSAHALNGHG